MLVKLASGGGCHFKEERSLALGAVGRVTLALCSALFPGELLGLPKETQESRYCVSPMLQRKRARPRGVLKVTCRWQVQTLTLN